MHRLAAYEFAYKHLQYVLHTRTLPQNGTADFKLLLFFNFFQIKREKNRRAHVS